MSVIVVVCLSFSHFDVLVFKCTMSTILRCSIDLHSLIAMVLNCDILNMITCNHKAPCIVQGDFLLSQQLH